MEKRRSTVRPYTMTKGTLFPVASLMLLGIVLARMTEDRTAGMALAPVMVYLMCYCIFMIACRKRVFRFVRMYCNNRFYVNAKESSRFVLYETLGIVFVAAVLLVLFARPAAALISGDEKAGLSLYLCAGCLLFCGAEGILAGFAEGMGKRRQVLATDVIRALLMIGIPVPFAFLGYRYGAKLDALLYTTDCAAAYAAAFATAGLLISDVILTLTLLLLRRSSLRSLYPLEETGKERYTGEKPAFFKAVAPLAFTLSLPHLLVILLCALFRNYMYRSDPFTDTAAMLGALYGHYLPFTVFLGILMALPFLEACYRLPENEDAPESGRAGTRFLKLTHRQCVLCLPAGIFLTALAEPVETAVFRVPTDVTQMLLLVGAMLTPLLTFAVTNCTLLALTKRFSGMIGGGILAVLTGTVLTFVLLRTLQQGLIAVVAGLMLGCLVFGFYAYVVLTRLMHVKRLRLLQLAGFPLVFAALSALPVFFLGRSLSRVIGEVAAVAVSVLAGSVIYLFLMALTGGLITGDLEGLPLGETLERISLRRRRR
ncbi:MAG: hypothetical protein IJR00_09150 [Lachnospiraceae bacterium]|nr:hypothetical protein [Lachnospiraceae bacterium]